MSSFWVIVVLIFGVGCSGTIKTYSSTDELCQDCPCEKMKNDKIKVDCSDTKLGRMPNFSESYFDTNVTRYSVERSAIKEIERKHIRHFPNLERLFLFGNDISDLPEDLFRNSTKLTLIRLRNNKIKIIPKTLFTWTPNMKTVSLGENGIEELHVDTFRGLKNLTGVWLYQNYIKALPNELFRDNIKLKTVLFGSANLSLEVSMRDENTSSSKNITKQVVQEDSASWENNYIWSSKHNNINELPKGLFNVTTNLEKVSFSKNKIKSIPRGFFKNGANLKSLFLYGNEIRELNQQVFVNMKKLRTLDLSSNQISNLKSNMFINNNPLKKLNLSENKLTEIRIDTFNGLDSLLDLDISHMHSMVIDWNFLSQLPRLKTLHTSDFFHCCHAKLYKPSLDCITPNVAISSCSDLIKSPYLRVLIWINFILAIGCNVVAITLRSMTKRGERDRGQNALVINLAISDLIMGIYLAIIATNDLSWRDVYFKHDHHWRNSNLCHLTGLLSFLSSQISVFTLGVITYFRYMAIVHSLQYSRQLTRRSAFLLIGIIWALALGITVPPTIFSSYFRDEVSKKGFYGSNGVCVALQLPGKRAAGWEYSLAIFGVLNLVLCLHMAGSYVRMFVTTFKSPKTPRSSVMNEEIAIAVRFFVVVFTDICCWLPVSMLMILSSFNAVDHANGELYAWFAICVIPINSTLNPLVYTLTAPGVLKRMKDISNAIQQLSFNEKEYVTKTPSSNFEVNNANKRDAETTRV